MAWKPVEQLKKIVSKETGAVVKDSGGKVRMALVYPNTYFIGMSNLGLHTIYKIANSSPRVVCERFFLGEALSLESQRPLSDFDIVAFSVPFENDYLNILPILDAAKIPFLRTERRPFLIAGGAAVTLNPGPIARFFDALALGDGEEVVPQILDTVKNSSSFEGVIDSLKNIQGIYIPELHKNQKITPNTVKDLDKHPCQTVIWTKDTEFGDMHLIELQRGCPWRCKFCSTPVIYPDFRNLSFESAKGCVMNGFKNRKKFGLIGGDPLAHPSFNAITEFILRQGGSFSPSSLRADRITRDTARILKLGGIKTATIAPEAGSEILRNSLDKKISDKKILAAAKNLAEEGITQLKLYFMIGLPREKETDLDSVVSLTKEIHKALASSRKNKLSSVKITVAINPFVPKKNTFLENEPFCGVEELQKKIKHLKQRIGKIPNTRVSAESPRTASTEATLNKLGDDGSEFLIERWKRCTRNIS